MVIHSVLESPCDCGITSTLSLDFEFLFSVPSYFVFFSRPRPLDVSHDPLKGFPLLSLVVF